MSRVWLITGASTGLGRSIAEAAAERGDVVVATARQPDSLTDFQHARALDVTDDAQVQSVIESVIKEHGRIDVLVNNAGHGLIGATEEVTDDELRALLEVNLLGVLRVTRAALPHLRRQRSGHIVQMSSVGGVVGNAGHSAYAISKFALEGMSEALAGEVADWGIKVTLVEPGPFRTDFAGRSLVATEPIDAYVGTTAGRLRQTMINQHGRQPNDPAKAALAIMTAVDASEPPLRLPLGPEAVSRIRTKLHRQLATLDDWESVAVDTRFG